MKRMGRYCKAYPVEKFREFEGWSEKRNQPPQSSNESHTNIQTDAHSQDEFTEGATYWFVQEDYTVTSDVFLDSRVVFDNVTADWIAFCKVRLKLLVPNMNENGTEGTEERKPGTIA